MAPAPVQDPALVQTPRPVEVAVPPAAVGAFFDFPSAAEPALRVTHLRVRWTDLRNPILPELTRPEGLE